MLWGYCGWAITRWTGVMGAVLVFALLAPSGAPRPAPETAQAATLPPGFSETVVFSGLTEPTVVRFAADGRVFVAEKSGVIKVFDNLSDTTPTLFTDLSTTDGTPNNVLVTRVHNFWDRGLLGMTLHPDFPSTPYVYVLYAHDAVIGGTAPRWGTAGGVSDGCPSPPGPTGDGCVVSGRLSRLQAAGNVMTGTEHVLVEDWCQQYPSHSTGSVEFGPDGALYATGGDGASFNFADYGQDGSPVNPCGDPPGGVGSALTPPSAEGGALRSQDLRTAGDPVSLDGSVIRVNPSTGAGLPDNPFAGSSDANAKRIIAYGLRNPFRFTFRPETSELWIGDVGWNIYEEINRVLDPTDAVVENFGWPCYEGNPKQSGYDTLNLAICENLYDTPSADTKPFFAYHHSNKVVPSETCPTGSSSISGLSFEFTPTGSTFPAAYEDALFFSDYSRDCIWVMKKNGNPIPSPGSIDTFVAAAANPVNVEFGPGGDLFYVDFAGSIRRVHYNDTTAPTVTSTTPTGGATGVALGISPTAVFSESMNPSTLTTSTFTLVEQGEGTPLPATVSYDVASRTATLDPSSPLEGNAAYTATVESGSSGAKDLGGNPLASDFSWTFQTNRAPTPVIDTPGSSLMWKVDDSIAFTGHATDPEQGALPGSALSWTLLLQHCPSNCHSHSIQSWPGVAGASFDAPDHEHPSYLDLQLTATDAAGASATTTLRLDPMTVALTFQTIPSGLQLSVNGTPETAPFTRTVIQGSTNSLSAPSPQELNGTSYEFSAWSDAGEPAHNLVASTDVDTYTASYASGPLDSSAVADFDGDNDTDISVYRPSEHRWYSSNGVTPFTYWGMDGDLLVPANYDGVGGDDDFAVFRPSEGRWYVNDGVTAFTTWGVAGDIPVPGDYNDDGDDDFAVFRPSEGRWYVNDDGVTSSTSWGVSSDILVPGDYNGDGDDDIAVFRPSEGRWYVNDGVTPFTTWGVAGDIPVPGDYNDDGDDDFAVYRPSEGRWYMNDDGVTSATTWGNPGPLSSTSDRPEPGDYNGDGQTDIAVFRPSEGRWYVNDGVTPFTTWGDACDIQLPLPYAIRSLIPRDGACLGTNG